MNKKILLFLMLFGFGSMRSSELFYQNRKIEELGEVRYYHHPYYNSNPAIMYLSLLSESLQRSKKSAYEDYSRLHFQKKAALDIGIRGQDDPGLQEAMKKLHNTFVGLYGCSLDSDGFIAENDVIKLSHTHCNTLPGAVLSYLSKWKKSSKPKLQIFQEEQHLRTNIDSEFLVESNKLAWQKPSLIPKLFQEERNLRTNLYREFLVESQKLAAEYHPTVIFQRQAIVEQAVLGGYKDDSSLNYDFDSSGVELKKVEIGW